MVFGRSTANDASAAWITDLAIDASGKVGIGTDSPAGAGLTVAASNSGKGVEIQPSTGSLQYVLAYDRTVGASGYINLAISGYDLQFQTGAGVKKMSIDQNGQMEYQGAEPGTTGIRFQGSGTCNGYAGSLASFYVMDVMRDQGSGKSMNVQGTIDIAAGYGIGFGASAGAGATSTLLDDYEEGTWTPVAYASSGTATGSYSQQLGTYTKIGRQVICMFDFQVTLSGTMVGFAGISGLPFTVGNSSAGGGSMAGYSVNQFRSSDLFAAAGAGRQISGFPQQNANYIYCQVDNSGVNGFGSAAAATWKIGTSGRCTGYVVYFTD